MGMCYKSLVYLCAALCISVLPSYHFERHPVLPAAWSWLFPVEVSGSHCHSVQVSLVSPAGKMAESRKERHVQ